MADIKQAARWMKEGMSVKRPDNEDDGVYAASVGFVERNEENRAWLTVDDLLADDWEIADK